MSQQIMTNKDALIFAFVPGQAEIVERAANRCGNLAWYGMAQGVKYTRNAFYIFTALTAIGTIGTFYSGISIARFGFQVLTGASFTLTGLALFRLHHFTTLLQRAYNAGARLN